MKKITLLLLLTLSILGAKAQTVYQLNYDSVRVGKTAGTSGISLYGKVYMKNLSSGLSSDSILTVRNGRILKVSSTPTVTTSTISSGGTANGISINSGVIRLHKATATTGGVLTTGADTIAGQKRFTVSSGTAADFVGSGTGVITVNTSGSMGRITSSDNKLVLSGASGDASLRAVTGGFLEIPSTAGATDAIVYSNVNGLIGRLGIGTGLSMAGGVLAATGGGTGTIGGSGTTGYIPVFSGASSIANGSLSDNSAGAITVNGAAASVRVGSNASDYATFSYSGGGASVRNDWASTSGFIDLNANSVGLRVYGTGTVNVGYTTDQGFKLAVNGTTNLGGALTATSGVFSSTLSASNLSGTNTGDQTNITGNAGTATLASNSSALGGIPYSGSTPSSIQYAMVYDNINAQFRIATASQLNSFTGATTAVTVATANGFTGSSSGGSTPALTLATSFNSPIVAAVAGSLTAATTTGTGSTAVLSASPALTGTPTAPTASAGTNTTQVATTAFVQSAIGANISSGTLTFSGNGATTDFNTGIIAAGKLIITATSADAAGNVYVNTQTGCGGICTEYHVVFASPPASGTNNVTFSYILVL